MSSRRPSLLASPFLAATLFLWLASGAAAWAAPLPEGHADRPGPTKHPLSDTVPSTSAPPESGPPEACRVEDAEDQDRVEEARRVLQETMCGAVLWFDGLFGDERHVHTARETSGRVELVTLYSEFGGIDVDGRLRLRYQLPNLEERVNVFLGRGDDREVVEDREEGFAVRASGLGLESARRWVAGLGFTPPGRLAEGAEFRVGARPSTSPSVFGQIRLRQDTQPSDQSFWHFRETLFWDSREGFGVTAGVDFDRVLTPEVLVRWSNIGTLSEASPGLDWRTAGILYRSLGGRRAVAGELFARGATSADVPLHEYGARGVLRFPLGRPHLFGELVLGYSWPREELSDRRTGSTTIGIGTELLFGQFLEH
jgi:hypothetical protein